MHGYVGGHKYSSSPTARQPSGTTRTMCGVDILHCGHFSVVSKPSHSRHSSRYRSPSTRAEYLAKCSLQSVQRMVFTKEFTAIHSVSWSHSYCQTHNSGSYSPPGSCLPRLRTVISHAIVMPARLPFVGTLTGYQANHSCHHLSALVRVPIFLTLQITVFLLRLSPSLRQR